MSSLSAVISTSIATVRTRHSVRVFCLRSHICAHSFACNTTEEVVWREDATSGADDGNDSDGWEDVSDDDAENADEEGDWEEVEEKSEAVDEHDEEEDDDDEEEEEAEEEEEQNDDDDGSDGEWEEVSQEDSEAEAGNDDKDHKHDESDDEEVPELVPVAEGPVQLARHRVLGTEDFALIEKLKIAAATRAR